MGRTEVLQVGREADDLVVSPSLPRIQPLCSTWDISVSDDIHKDHQHRAGNGSP